MTNVITNDRLLLIGIIAALLFAPSPAGGGKPPACSDGDGDGYGNPGSSVCPRGSAADCNDANAAIHPGASEICGNSVDENCNGSTSDGCGVTAEKCTDGVDNDGDGKIDCADSDCGADASCGVAVVAHRGINAYTGPETCIGCHATAGSEVLNSMHGGWLGPTPNVTNIAGDAGKLGQTNNYCTDPEVADYACLKCHVSNVAPVVGGRVDMSRARLVAANMDCLQCHNDKYRATFNPTTPITRTNCVDGGTKTYQIPTPESDGKIHKYPRYDLMPAGTTMIGLARGATRPTNASCLAVCHSKAGGGDGVKRGDLGSDMINPPLSQDVHLSAAGGALRCTSCHAALKHQIPGRGNDLRGEDIGAVMKKCVDCHAGKDSKTGHATAQVNNHQNRVSCQACHIDYFGKGIGTELSRDWRSPSWNPGGCEGQGAWIGHEVKATNQIPAMEFWNGTSWVYDRNSPTGLLADSDGKLAFSKPNGGITSGKLYPFKIHTGWNPVAANGRTSFDVVEMFMTGCFDDAARSGLDFIGETGAYSWKETKAYQLITHGVAPASAVACTKCHPGSRTALSYATVTMLDAKGYKLKDVQAKICAQCHAEKTPRDHVSMHNHVATKGIDCYFCHTFSRKAERIQPTLCNPCEPCAASFVDTNPYAHACPSPQ